MRLAKTANRKTAPRANTPPQNPATPPIMALNSFVEVKLSSGTSASSSSTSDASSAKPSTKAKRERMRSMKRFLHLAIAINTPLHHHTVQKVSSLLGLFSQPGCCNGELLNGDARTLTPM